MTKCKNCELDDYEEDVPDHEIRFYWTKKPTEGISLNITWGFCNINCLKEFLQNKLNKEKYV